MTNTRRDALCATACAQTIRRAAFCVIWNRRGKVCRALRGFCKRLQMNRRRSRFVEETLDGSYNDNRFCATHDIARYDRVDLNIVFNTLLLLLVVSLYTRYVFPWSVWKNDLSSRRLERIGGVIRKKRKTTVRWFHAIRSMDVVQEDIVELISTAFIAITAYRTYSDTRMESREKRRRNNRRG